ncbi:transposase [Limosilactobacillus sp. Lr3000]|uniref:Transposase n=1 Tax=Limosilactobacillus albertensis TaxID=2759752 RepID=A0A839H5T6_9LACO|nr:transposase [Limosilactobacillus albertensis]
MRITDVLDLTASNSADQEHTKLIKARIIIDRFHIVQLVGRALDNC